MSPPFFNPVALTSIERLHFLDSSNRFPNRITCRLLSENSVDFFAAKKAYYFLTERHPILGCLVKKVDGRLSWVRDPDLFQSSLASIDGGPTIRNEPSVDWFHVQRLDSPPDSPPDFLTLLGEAEFYRPCLLIRQWAGRGSNDPEPILITEIWLSIHHAFCDGAGGIQLISDWMQIYENLISGLDANEGLPALDHGRFEFRNKLGLGKWKFFRVLPFQAIGLFGATKFVFRKSIQTSNREPNQLSSGPEQHPGVPSMVSTWLSADDLLAVEQLSQAGNFNSNAKFLGDLFSTIETWHRKTNESAKPGEWVRIILPINVREIGDRRLSAANRSSLIQIDRRNVREVSLVDLYRSIQREIGIVMRFQLDRMFLIMIRVIGLREGLLKRVVQHQKPRGIAVFTNLGRPFRRIEKRLAGGEASDRGGSLRLTEIDFLAPLRFGTPLNFSLARFQGRLRLTLHYDPRVFSSTEANELLNDYLNAIRSRPDSSLLDIDQNP